MALARPTRRRVTVDEAVAELCACVRQTRAEDVALADAVGRVLAAPVTAREDRPAAAESAMDGYAVRAADTERAPVVLRVIGESRAGAPFDGEVREGTAIRISTGALVPTGADAVVRQEDTSTGPSPAFGAGRDVVLGAEPGPAAATVTVNVAVAVGGDVRAVAEDWRLGATIATAGTLLTPHALAPLAGAGADTVAVRARPRIAVLATGDELLNVAADLGPGQVRDTSTTVLPALIARHGGEVVSAVWAGDTAAGLADALAASLAHSPDVLLVAGGASVGPHDLVRPAVAAAGFVELFGGVAVKPGGPAWAAHRDAGPLVVGLPGNPVASVVVAVLLVAPVIAAMLGRDLVHDAVTATLTGPARGAGGREHAVRGELRTGVAGWEFSPAAVQGSHQLTSLLAVNAVAFVPAGVDGQLSVGTPIQARFL